MWLIDQRSFVAPLAAEQHYTLIVRIPRCTAQRTYCGGWERSHVAPCVRIKIVGPHGRIVEVDLAPPLPTMAAAERGKTAVTSTPRVVHALLATADARPRHIPLVQGP